jgi:UDP-4-amino-4,6-dideoxy-N-acetyl-beta-L-altrosamine N-acetyltransferase
MTAPPSLRLRPIRASDSAQLLAWRNAPHVAAYMYTSHAIGQDEHDRWFASALTADDRIYWIIEAGGRDVGLANLTRIDRVNRKCDWAYYLGETSTRGQGIGAGVEYIILQHVFGPLGLNKLCCEVFVDNEAVWKLHESFGFIREALYRDHVFKDDGFKDVVGLGLLARDWAAARPACEARLREKGRDPADLVIAPE